MAEIPGCQLGEQHLDVPHTAWMLEVVLDCLARAECPPPPPLHAILPSFTPARPLFAHQEQAVRFALAGSPGVLIADDMGLGKSAEAAVAAENIRRSYHDPARPGVIVGPLFTRGTWRSELRALGILESEEDLYVLSGREPEPVPKSVKWFFVHYDIVLNWWSQLQLLRPAHPVVAIVDEAHWIRNSRTLRAKGTLSSAGTCAYRLLLTGTPLDSKPAELWFPLSLATGQRTWGGPLDFRRRYCGAISNGYGHEDGEPTNIEELRTRMVPYFLRRTATDAGLKLPALLRSPIWVELDPAQLRAHYDVLTEFGASMEDLVVAIASGAIERVLPVLNALRKVTGWAKAPATIAQVRNVLDQGESAVVFCWERRVAATIANALPSKQTRLVTGEQDQNDRDEIVESFQRSTMPSAIVATYGALREGVTLHRARIAILNDTEWVLSAMLQAEKRIHRIGQTRSCNVLWMLAEKSIDVIIAEILLHKASMMQDVLAIPTSNIVESSGLQALQQVSVESVEDQVERAMRVWSGP